MKTRSANPENPKSDSGKKVPPKKGMTKTPTKTHALDIVKEIVATPSEKKPDSTPGGNASKIDEQAKQMTPKEAGSKSDAEEKAQAEGAKAAKGNISTNKSVETKGKVSPVVKVKGAVASKGKGADGSRPKLSDSSVAYQSKSSGSNEKNEGKQAVRIEQPTAKTDETADPSKEKELSSNKLSAECSDMKVENGIKAQGKPVEPKENEDECGDGEGGEEEEEEPEEMEQLFEEMEEYGGEQENEEVEDDYEEEEAGEDEAEEDEAGEDEAEEDEEQHEIEMPVGVQERRRRKEFEVFVGGLDKDAVEEDLRKVFSQVGDVEVIRLLRNPLTNKNKGFAFVGFATTEQAKRAVNELKNPSIRGKRCGVAPSEDNDTLFLGNICKTWTKEAVKNKLKDYGVDGLEEITLVGDTQNEGLSRGFAFLEFSTHMDAMKAYKRLQKPDVIFGGDRTAKVAFAEPLREPDAEVMAQVKSVFVDGLPPFWDEDRVKEHLKRFGDIEKVVLARNMPTAKRRDFGFVNFQSHEQAEACIEGLNNTMIIDGEAKLKVKVRLANPLPKSQAVKGGMRGGFPIGRNGIGIRVRPGWSLGVGRPSFKKVGMSRGRGFISRGRAQGVSGRGGRFSLRADDDVNSLFRTFREQLIHDERRGPIGRGRHPAGTLRRGSYRSYTRQNDTYDGRTSASTRAIEHFDTRAASGSRPLAYKDSYVSRRGGSARSGVRPLSSRRHSFPPAEDLYSGPLDRDLEQTRLRPNPYTYEHVNHGAKRPYSAVDEHLGYAEPVRGHTRTRYDYSGPISSGSRYSSQQTLGSTYDGLTEDSVRTGTGLYSSSYAGTSDYYPSELGGSSYSSLYGGSRTLGRGSYF